MPRDPALDILKGVGILSVVVAHVFSGVAHGVAYLFHMPLFFLVAGYFFRPAESFWAALRKATTRLMIPYVAFLVLIQAPRIYAMLMDDRTEALVRLALKSLVGGEKLTGWVGVFWFPTCLYLSQLAYQLIATHLREGARHGVVLALLGAAYLVHQTWPNFWLPMAANVVPVSLFFFHVGWLYKKNGGAEKMAKGVAWFAVFFTAWYLVGILTLHWPAMGMKRGNFGWPLVTPLAAMAATLTLHHFSIYLVRFRLLARGFSYMGSASLVIMYVHQAVQIHLHHDYAMGKWARFAAGLLVPVVLYALIQQIPLLHPVLLGRTTKREVRGRKSS